MALRALFHDLAEVSIHAPLAGRDRSRVPGSTSWSQFQSTRPSRGATMFCVRKTCWTPEFQSTRPSRGATS